MTRNEVPVLDLRQVRKTFPDGFEAVRGVDLTVERGTLTALAGTSGCGKTTTLKLINRLEDASGGSVLFEGRDVADMDKVELRRQIGWVMQGDGLFPHFTIEENLAVVPRLLGWQNDRIASRNRELLELVHMDDAAFAGRYPGELSGGQRQRIGFARALAVRPDLLLMDEPFSALDPLTRDSLQRDFMNLQRELGFTAVMVTHDMAEALIMADQIAVMSEGAIIQSGTPAELLGTPADSYVEQLLETPRRQMRAIRELGA